MKTIKNLLLLALAFNFVVACSKSDDPEPVNEEEVITTLEATLVPDSGATITLTSRDLDGEGPNEPVLTVSGNLQANTSYDGTFLLLNETESPAEDVTEEILEEDDEHQFFFSFTNNIASVTYADADDDGNPIGVKFTMNTGDAGTGNATFVLKHQPNKTASGVAQGDMTNAGGSTDIEVTFALVVE